MKKFIQFSLVALSALIGFTACQKDYDATPDVVKNPTSNFFNGSVSCTIDSGFYFVSEVQQATTTTNNGIKSVGISGTRYDESRVAGVSKTILVSIGNYTGAKKYGVPNEATIMYIDAKKDGTTVTYRSSIPNPDFHVTTTGEYQGTFSATLVDQNNANNKIQVVNGKFDLRP